MTHHHSKANNHQNHGMGHGDARNYLKRFWIVTILLIPLVLVQPQVAEFLNISFELNKWIQFGIATIIFVFALIFFQHAGHEIKAKKYGMMTLVSIAVGSGYLFSVFSTFLPSLKVEFYLEISTLIWVLLLGHYLEAKSGSLAGNALQEIAKLLPKKAHKIEKGKEIEIEIMDLKVDDVVIVKPGEKIPADGIIIKGFSNIDESLISGESKPIYKEKGGQVIAGSINLDGVINIKILRTGENSTIGQIQKLIIEAGQTKPNSQKIADKAAGILTFITVFIAILALFIWKFWIGESFVFSLTLAITVLVISCPHALGLAIPTVTTITTSIAVKNGLFIKDLSKIEEIQKVDLVIFDKTGTLTEGKFKVNKIVTFEKFKEKELLNIAASLEKGSSHIIGHAILDYAKSKKVKISEISNFRNIAGQGVKAKINGIEYFVGNEKIIKKFGFEIPKNISGTIVFVANKATLLGYIILADSIKENSFKTVKELHKMGINVAMLTGDNQNVAREVSKKLNIDQYFADILPEDKYKYIREIQNQGNIVLMVGDGVNDAPALIQANIGVAIGAGTDIAVESGDIVLMNNDPLDVVKLIKLSKKVYQKMIENLIWALGYNIIAIPSAAGIFASFGFFLSPEVGALIMSLSTVIVVINALFLKRVKI